MMLPGKGHHFRHGDQTTVQVGNDNGAGFRSERRGQILRNHVPVVGVHIDQNRLGADGMNVEEIARVIISRHDDFIAGPDLQSAQGQLNRKSAAAAQKREFDAEKVAQGGFQSRSMRALVIPPGTVADRVLDCLVDILIRWRPGGRSLRPNGGSAQKCWSIRHDFLPNIFAYSIANLLTFIK